MTTVHQIPPMPRREDAAVKLLLTEIKYEVKFDTWLKEKILTEEERNKNKDAKVVNYAYKNDKAEDWLVRKIQDAVDRVYGELRWCVVDPSQFQSDEILENPTEWTIHFVFGRGWSGSVRALKSFIHRYVCEYVLGQWYRITNPVIAESYMMNAEDYIVKAYEEARSQKVKLEPFRL